MKVMLVSDSEELRPIIQESFSYHNADVIHYDNPIKAMDNLEEIEPDVVLFGATDFPRHWKPFIAYLRNTFSRRETVFVLLVSDDFDSDEREKAEHLQVNAVITQAGADGETTKRIRGILTRYYQKLDIRSAARYMPSRADSISFSFTNPYSFRIVPGRIIDISSGGLQFRPDSPEEINHLDIYARIAAASIRLGEKVLPVKLKIVRVTDTIAFEFADLSLEAEHEIGSYLSTLIARDRDQLNHSVAGNPTAANS